MKNWNYVIFVTKFAWKYFMNSKVNKPAKINMEVYEQKKY